MGFGPVVAGHFYPANADQLTRQIDGFLKDARLPEFDQGVFGLISPHAGYVYSGPCAAHGFRALMGRHYDLVVVIGLSHRVEGTVSILTRASYDTPLGAVPVDVERSRRLLEKLDFADDNERLFSVEHSIEVQLPFLQRTLEDFRVVLISMRTVSETVQRQLAEALDEVTRDCSTLFVASSDLSHFHDYDQASAMDHETLAFVEAMDLEQLDRSCRSGSNEMCGIAPVLTVLRLYERRGGGKPRLLSYMNSGDTAGDRGRVVGYGSVLLPLSRPVSEKIDATQDDAEIKSSTPGDFLSPNDRRELLRIAKSSVVTWVRQRRRASFDVDSQKLLDDGAAFVTLHRAGELRGCIGHVEAREPLWECVRDMAIAAATQDPRFPEVRPDEVEDLHFEISVLTPPKAVAGPSDIVPGRDGLIVSDGFQRGLLLPQVASRYGWKADEFLDNTCLKAGLSRNAWRTGGVTIQTFQAVVFDENEIADAQE